MDLDELARIGKEDEEAAQRRQRQRARTGASEKSFDDLVGSDGMLKRDAAASQTATGAETADGTARKRGTATYFAAGSALAAASNPFDDENIWTEHDRDQAPSRESSATIDGQVSDPPVMDLMDFTRDAPPVAGSAEEDPAAQSFYSFTSSDSQQHLVPQSQDAEDEGEYMSTGTLTPRSEHSAFTGASVVGSHADDVAVLSTHNDSDVDGLADAMSDAGFTEGGFSDVGDGHAVGIMTPSSWTDVGSDDGSEWGGAAQDGHVSQLHR